ncbi:MAG: phenylalanine--tRNA ligase subunit beta [Steroidobacteraceae bacterium]
MKVPYSWLNEWVKVPWGAPELGARLTMAGFELEALETAAPPFTGVVVGEIVTAERRPRADRLKVCRVSRGSGAPLTIVCGAPNARAGLKSALAIVGAKLPGDLTINAAELRGVESQGMLASAKELGLAESSGGILELPADAPVGKALRAYLELDEPVLDLNVTPNRGDAMSILGMAREVSALLGRALVPRAIRTVPEAHKERFKVQLAAPRACPSFAGCIVKGVNNRAVVPLWLRERLRRAGLRSISPVVDVTNYVMLELGQPMHAYDLKRLKGGIRVRLAQRGERLRLLDGREIEAERDMLLIADAQGPVGLAGVMGGERTAVSEETEEIFFESAYFSPAAIMGRARRVGLTTDASQRFERGVDPTQQARAIRRALELLTPIAGGHAGPVEVTQSARDQPKRRPVTLRAKQLSRLLGVALPARQVASALTALGMKVKAAKDSWHVAPPAHRFDIAIEADLIEEVARIVGFERIPETDALIPQRFPRLPAEQPPETALLEVLAARGYQETVTFAFVDPALQQRLFGSSGALALANPLSSDLSAMRVSLWPGLLKVARDNERRQQERVRLFEQAARFEPAAGAGAREIATLAGLASGARLPEQWGVSKEERAMVDFYDVKDDLEALFAATGVPAAFTFAADAHPALHPGRSARVLRDGARVGWLGELHPALAKELDFTYAPVLFELDLSALAVKRAVHQELSRFPQVRRDLAVVVDESVTLSRLAERVTLATSSLLRGLRVFDVYRGPGLEPGRKSVALGLIFQDISRTLTDDDVERLMASVVSELRESLNARIRE